MPDDESAVGDLFSPSVEDTGVLADLEGDAAAEADIELVLDLGGDSARNGLSCLAVVSLRDLGDRGEEPDRGLAFDGDGRGDPGESFLPPRDLVIPGEGTLIKLAEPPASLLSLFFSALNSPAPFLFPPFPRFFAVLFLAAFLAEPVGGSERQKADRQQKATKNTNRNNYNLKSMKLIINIQIVQI